MNSMFKQYFMLNFSKIKLKSSQRLMMKKMKCRMYITLMLFGLYSDLKAL